MRERKSAVVRRFRKGGEESEQKAERGADERPWGWQTRSKGVPFGRPDRRTGRRRTSLCGGRGERDTALFSLRVVGGRKARNLATGIDRRGSIRLVEWEMRFFLSLPPFYIMIM